MLRPTPPKEVLTTPGLESAMRRVSLLLPPTSIFTAPITSTRAIAAASSPEFPYIVILLLEGKKVNGIPLVKR